VRVKITLVSVEITLVRVKITLVRVEIRVVSVVITFLRVKITMRVEITICVYKLHSCVSNSFEFTRIRVKTNLV
jgi:hypothetical protein